MADLSSTYQVIGIDSLSGPFGAAERSMTGMEAAAGRVGGAFLGLAETAAKTALAVGALSATAFVGGMTAAITTAASFEKQLSAISSVSSKAELDAAGGMQALSAAALKLGADTSFSASQAAAGMEEMVKAGISITDVLGGGARAALDLAAAGGVEVAEAATVASSAMNAFALAGSDMTHIADELAGASVASATDVHQLGFAMAAVGAVAHGIGLSFDDTTTAIAALAQAGLKGSDSGTSLKTMLLGLSPSTKAAKEEMQALGIITADGANQFFDAAGNAKGMADIAGVLQNAMKGLTKEQQLNALQTIFGTDAIRAATIMANLGADGINKMADAEKAAGSAQAIANERLNNLAGSIEKFKGSLEVASITMGQHFLPPLKSLVDIATEGLNRALPMFDRFGQVAADAFAGLIAKVSAAGPAITAIGTKALSLAQGVLPAVGRAFVNLGQTVGGFLGLPLDDITAGWSTWGAIAVRVVGLATTAIGGLVGAVRSGLPAVQAAFSTLLPIIENVGQGMITNIADTIRFVTERVIPPLISIVQQTAPLFTGTLLPAFQQTGAVLRGVLGDTLDWLAKTAWPPLLAIAGQTADLWTSKVLPSIAPLAAALRTTLGESLNWLATTGWPALTAAASTAIDLFNTYVVPSIQPVATAIRSVLGDAITWISTTGWPLLTAGAATVSTFITGTLLPAVTNLATWLKTNVPPALQAVVTAFTDLKTRLTPIVQAVFAGDIKAALTGLSSAFADFGRLVGGWLGEQVAKVDWAAIWAQAKDVLAATADWFIDAGTRFAGWIGDQVAQINWTDVWNKAVSVFDSAVMWFGDAAGKLATWIGEQVTAIKWEDVWNKAVAVFDSAVMWFGDAATKLGTWIGAQAALIDWAGVWSKVTTAGSALGTWLLGQAIDFATWTSDQAGKIPWAVVWANVKTAGTSLGTYLLTQTVDMTTWLHQEAAKIVWADVFKDVQGVGAAMQAAMVKDTQAHPLVWAEILGPISNASQQWAAWMDSVASDVQWEERGKVWGAGFVKALKAMFDGGFTEIAGDTGAWAGWGDKIDVSMLGAIAEALARGSANAITTLSNTIIGWLTGAWEEAIKGWNPTWPGWVPGVGGKPINGNPAPSPGAGGPTPGQGPAGQGTTTNYGLKNQMPASYTGEWERKAYAAAVKAGHPDPIQFVEQIREESGLDPNTPPSSVGAQGIAQIMPGTAQAWGVDPHDPNAALAAAAEHSAQYHRQYGPQLGLAAYNAGEGNVGRYGMGVFDPSFARGQTMRYESEINARTAAVRQEQQQQSQQATQFSGQQTTIEPFRGQAQAIGNQFELGLPRDQAEAACGPAAVALFIAATGRTPNAQEVMQISAKNGWTAARGMGGPAAFMATLGEEGVQAAMLAPTGQAAAGSVQGGSLTAISTGGGNVPLNAGHYFVAQGFDPATQQFDLGETGGPDPTNPGAAHALRGGSRFMTAEEITALAGPINGVIQLLGQTVVAAQGADQAVNGTALSFKGMAEQAVAVNPAIAQMSTDTITSVDAMGERITTFSTDTLGSYITTTTDTSGQVIGLWGEMSNGVQLNMANTAAGVTTTTQQMGTDLLTTVADAMGNTVTTVTDSGGQVVAQWSATAGQVTATNAAMGTQIVADTNGAVTQQNSIFTIGGEQQVATAQTTATGVVAANTDMTTQATGLVQTMATGVLTSVTDMGNGVTMTVTTTANGTVSTLTNWKGQVIGVYTDTESQTSEAVDTMATNTAEAGRKVGETAGAMGQAFRGTGEAAKGATPPVKDFGAAAASVKPINMGDTVQNLQKVERAAISAERALTKLGEAGKHVSGSGGSGGGGGTGGGRKGGGDAEGFQDGGVLPEDIYGLGPSGRQYRLHGGELVIPPGRPGYIMPNAGLGVPSQMDASGSGAPVQTIVIQVVDPDGRTLEEWFIRGRDLAAQRMRD